VAVKGADRPRGAARGGYPSQDPVAVARVGRPDLIPSAASVPGHHR